MNWSVELWLTGFGGPGNWGGGAGASSPWLCVMYDNRLGWAGLHPRTQVPGQMWVGLQLAFMMKFLLL